MKKILVVIQRLGVSSGLTSFYMNYYLLMGKTEHQIDFLQIRDEESPYRCEIEKRGGRIFTFPKYKNNRDPIVYKYIYTLFKEGNYQLIHVNIADFRAALILCIAKHFGVPCRVYHSHNTLRVGEPFKSRALSRIYDYICVHKATDLLACTEQAGKEVFFGRHFSIMKNAINVNKYVFSQDDRNRIRNELGLEGKFVIGTVCRQAQQKNPFFVIDILAEYNKNIGEAYLLWIGSGPLFNDVQRYVEKLGLLNRVLLVGDKADVNKWYSAMDAFLMPSLFEGLGIVYIEAQVSGLPTFASDCVPKDSNLTDLIHYISLTDSATTWATAISNGVEGVKERRSRNVEVLNAGYGVSIESNALRDYYDERINR